MIPRESRRVWLREIRKDRDLTQQEVATLIGVSKITYSSIEAGVRNPSHETAKKIGKALRFAWTDFFKAG